MKENDGIGKLSIILLIGIGSLRASFYMIPDSGQIGINGILSYIFSIVVILLLSGTVGELRTFFKIKTGWGKTITGGWYIVGVSGVFLFIQVNTMKSGAVLSFDQVVCFALICLLTAIFEEIWFRGLLQGCILRMFKRREVSSWYGICIVATLFALMHLCNLLTKPEYVIGTCTQVLYTFSLGLMLGVIFYQSGNLAGVIFLHTIFNFCGSLSTLEQNATAYVADISIGSALFLLFLILPGIIWARALYIRNDKSL